MTWPFENDTSAVVKRLSNRNIAANRKRNIFIVLTVALASALLSAIVLYGFGVPQQTQNLNKKTAQIVYHAISEQQGQELYSQEEIAWVGEFSNAFSEQVNHSTVNFTYANAAMLKSQSMSYSGNLPTAEDEILVQESFLDSLGYSNELGQTIKIPFSDGTTHDFKLTGILNVKTGDIGRYTAIISKKLVEQQYGNHTVMDYYIGLKDAQNMSEKEAASYANTLDYDELVSQNGIILINHTAENLSLSARLGNVVEIDFLTKSGQTITNHYTIMGIVSNFSHPAFNMCFAMPMELMNEACEIDCSGAVSVITETDKSDTIEASLNQLIDGTGDLVMDTIEESISYYSRNQQLPFGALLIVAIIVVCFSLINLVNTTITNFLSRRQENGMLQAIGLSKKQLIRMLCYEGMIYSVFATLVTLILGAGLGFLCVQAVVKTMNPYFYYSFPWLVVLIYLAILLIVQFILISYTTGNLKKQSLVEQIRTTE